LRNKKVAPAVKVAIVLDRAFQGASLRELAQHCHVWLVGSEANVREARTFWAAFPGPTGTSSLTTFTPGHHPEPAAECAALLHNVELHHGPFSSVSPYSVVEVIGASLTPSLEQVFRSRGFSSFLGTAAGFQAERPPAT
jgi:hypothetical protein